MMLENKNWLMTTVAATLAVVLAAVGLLSSTLYPGATPALTAALFVGSVAATATAFTGMALRVRRLEMENLGLIEEISQEFDNVKDKISIFAEALDAPRSMSPQVPAKPADEPLRRVTIK
ncbi:MAG: hypothetical protein WDA16_14050 [Candidatus Thermoplasmatota archaeon]